MGARSAENSASKRSDRGEMEWTILPSQSLTSEIPEGFLTIDGDFGPSAPFVTLPSFGPVDHDRISFALLNLNHVSKNFIEHSFLNGWLESPRARLLSFGDSRNLKATEMVLASSLDEQLQGSSDQSYYPKRRVCPPHRITISIISLHSLGPRCLQMTRKGRYSIAAPIHGEKCLPSSRAI